jgi:putative ABC transport system permease protein
VLGVGLGAATSAPARAETLARLRTLGLRRAAARWLVLGELLPATLTAALGGLVVGAVVAGLATAPLALRLVTGGSSDPPLVVPWWIVVPALLVVASLLGVAAVETSVRRRERLGLVLRAGNA